VCVSILCECVFACNVLCAVRETSLGICRNSYSEILQGTRRTQHLALEGRQQIRTLPTLDDALAPPRVQCSTTHFAWEPRWRIQVPVDFPNALDQRPQVFISQISKCWGFSERSSCEHGLEKAEGGVLRMVQCHSQWVGGHRGCCQDLVRAVFTLDYGNASALQEEDGMNREEKTSQTRD
jgi:hypothetical protein